MKPIKFLALFCSLLVLSLIALNGVISGFWIIRVDPIVRLLPEEVRPTSPLWERVYWLAALALPVLYWLASFALWRRRPGALRIKTASGEQLLVHPGAIHKIVRHQVENHPAVVAQKIRVRQSGSRGLSVRAIVTIRPISSLPQIKGELEKAIRDGLSQVMGIEKVSDIQIVMGLDDKDLGVRPGSSAAAEPAPEPPMRSLAPPPESERPRAPEEDTESNLASTKTDGKTDGES